MPTETPKETQAQDNTNKSGDLPAKPSQQPADGERERHLAESPEARRERRARERAARNDEERGAAAALARSAQTVPEESHAERKAADVRAFFGGLNPEQVFARLPHWLQNNAIRSAMPEILTAVASEVVEAEKAATLGEDQKAYRTVDRGGNLRDIVPGREPRRGGGRMPDPVPTTAALTPKAPPLSASPPAPVAPNGETKFAPNPRGPR